MKAHRLTSLVAVAALFLSAGLTQDTLANTAPKVKVIVEASVIGQDGKIIIVRRRPPALRIEVRHRRPSRRHVWIDGHWEYRRGRYVWIRGRWVVRPHSRAVYVRPVWKRHGGVWVFVRGYWRH